MATFRDQGGGMGPSPAAEKRMNAGLQGHGRPLSLICL